MKTYVYFPLGGSRKGRLRTYSNLFITFLASGLWHGANWTFVLWGALHGLFVIFERRFNLYLSRIPNLIKQAAVFLLVSLLWILFRSPDFSIALKMYASLLNFRNISISSVGLLMKDGLIAYPAMIGMVYVLALLASLVYVVMFKRNTIEMATDFSADRKTLALTSVLFVISVIHLSRMSIFIYFNF